MDVKKKIMGIQCRDCYHKTYPKRMFCPNCRSSNLNPWELPTTGFIHSFTVINFPLEKYEASPYFVGLISFEINTKPLVTVNLVSKNTNNLKIGQSVNLSVNNNYGPFNRIVLEATIND
jgi:uncharacterized OB-fold protein